MSSATTAGSCRGGVVERLRRVLGAKLVSYLCTVPGTGWTNGSELGPRLEVAERAVMVLNRFNAPTVVQAWFQGANPLLGDRAPARVLVDEPVAQAGPLVLSAAEAYAH